MKRTSVILWTGLVLLVAAFIALFVFRASEPRVQEAGNSKSGSSAESAPANPSGQAAAGRNKLVVQYASPPPVIAPPRRAPTPIPVQAVVTREDKPYKPKFFSGQSERLRVSHNRSVPVQLSWPDDTTHQDVFVQAVQGGKIDNGANYKRFALGTDKTISFTFTPDAGPGAYDIVLRRGTVEEDLRFWVPTSHPSSDPITVSE